MSESLPVQKDRRAASSRERILEVAEALFAARGYSGVGMRQIATAVGLSKSSIFHHFSTKLVLYAEVLDRVIERLEWGLCGDDRGCGKAVDELDHWIDSLIGTLARDAPAARLILRAWLDEALFSAFQFEREGPGLMPFERRFVRVIDGFRVPLERGIADGVFRRVSIGDTIRTVMGAIFFRFAGGDLGAALTGEPVFSAATVERRRREVSEFIRRGLLV